MNRFAMGEPQREEGYVLTVLADLAERADSFASKLETQLAQAESVRQAITEALDRAHASRNRYKQVRSELAKAFDTRDDALGRAAEAAETVERAVRRGKELQQMIDYGVEDDQVFAEMGRANSAELERTVERDRFRAKADAASKRISECEQLLKDLELEVEERGSEVKELQKSLPDPHLFAYVGLAHFGRANAHLLLTRDASNFDRNLRQGAASVLRLHTELREGRYRLDKYGDLLAGRHEASVQAMYGAVAIGDLKLASEVFTLAADPGMYFHHIFNVWRTWLLGAYLLGDRRVLGELLKIHRYDKGLWRGYGRAFAALLANDSRELNLGVQMILKLEQRRDDVGNVPGLTLVHLPAAAIFRLARLRKIPITVESRMLPAELLQW